MDAMIKASGVKRAFPMPNGDRFWALKGIDMEVPKSSLTILKGRSGSGKTTLINILGALDRPTKGKVSFGSDDITRMGEGGRERLRRKEIGFVFQSVALIPMMSALENVEFALRMSKQPGDRTRRAAECLKLVGLAQRMNHMPQELSGGEQQRVAIARAIAHKPRVLFADEPTGELDTNTGLQVVKMFKELTMSQDVTIVMTTHDIGLMEIGDCVYELEDGEIINGGE